MTSLDQIAAMTKAALQMRLEVLLCDTLAEQSLA
jgi:hypothetical protein